MKYFIDTEFIEGFHKPLFGKRRHFIDLISIGIVAEDGREYYAISNEFYSKDADQWVKDNVISKLPLKLKENESFGQFKDRCKLDSNYSGRWYKGKSNNEIAAEIIHFCKPEKFLHNTAEPSIEFYGYYSDYDWVLFCSLFGRMIDLPKGFPMYCRDLKQSVDEKSAFYFQHYKGFPETQLKNLKELTGYPQQKDEHDALADARWNKELYSFLND